MGRRRKGEPPQMRRHKANNTAYVDVNGEVQILGPWGSPEAARAFKLVISAWERDHKPATAPHPKTGTPTVSELVDAFMDHAAIHYRRADGSQTDEVRAFRRTLEPVLLKHGHESPDDFEPNDLEAIVSEWVRTGHRRETCNKQAGRIKHVWRWGAAKKFVSPMPAAALAMTPSLQSGRTPARDYQEVEPVPIRDLVAVLRYCKRHRSGAPWCKWSVVEAMIRTAYLCGARQSEVLVMRGKEIHTKEYRVSKRTIRLPAGTWAFVPTIHKTRSKGKHVRYLIGPRLQKVLQPWIDRAAGGYLFPAAKNPHWDNGTWVDALELACKAMGVEPWSPGRLRHNFISRVSHEHGIAAASEAVSHSTIQTTQIYVERDLKKSAEIAKRHG